MHGYLMVIHNHHNLALTAVDHTVRCTVAGVRWRVADGISLFVIYCGKNNPSGHLVPGSQSHGTAVKKQQSLTKINLKYPYLKTVTAKIVHLNMVNNHEKLNKSRYQK